MATLVRSGKPVNLGDIATITGTVTAIKPAPLDGTVTVKLDSGTSVTVKANDVTHTTQTL